MHLKNTVPLSYIILSLTCKLDLATQHKQKQTSLSKKQINTHMQTECIQTIHVQCQIEDIEIKANINENKRGGNKHVTYKRHISTSCWGASRPFQLCDIRSCQVLCQAFS